MAKELSKVMKKDNNKIKHKDMPKVKKMKKESY